MNTWILRNVFWVIVAASSFVASSFANVVAEEPTTIDSEEIFARRIIGLLNEKCLACHGADPDTNEGSLDLRTLAGSITGGDSGEPSIVPGDSAASPLYLSVRRDHDDWSAMPAKESDALTTEQIQWIGDWIDSGAAWPSAQRIGEIESANADRWSVEDGIQVTTSGGLSPVWTNRRYDPAGLWAYQPVSRGDVPTGQADHPIDAFLSDAMPDGLQPAPTADRRTLIRRVTFDLTGLPPTPAEVTEFASDPRDDDAAFKTVVDRLLDSPHYGERMAQHWLDVTRYADTSGFANDFERGNAWRYRDYVVRAFNDDKPYDQFIREQIAGDEIDPTDPEKIIATGFLRMGPWELTSMEVARVARQRFLDDVTNSVGETFLAHSLQCARCHDHKFDPIPTQDYYAVQAVFATTQLAERRAAFLDVENRDGFDEQQYLMLRKREYKQTLQRLEKEMLASAIKWLAERDIDPADWNAAVDKAGSFGGARNQMRKNGFAEDQYPPKLVGFEPEDYGHERVARKGQQRLTWEMDRYKPFALAVYNGRTPQVNSVMNPTRVPDDRLTKGELEASCIRTNGDPFAVGDPVSPGKLSVLDSLGGNEWASFPGTIEGRRTAMADWITSADNPLTTRTIVNRIWMWHFGDAIAGNPNNFGSTGKRPTHPELLDWLASELVESNWSIKSLHRMILSSEAYRRSSRHPDPPQCRELDPLRTSYAVFQPRRLSAEELRDAMLATTGELNPTLGGIPNRPEINLEAALQPRQVMGTFASAWVPNPLPAQRHRRSLYSLKVRGLPDPQMEVFNQPAPDFSCEQRSVSTVTPQVFNLFNGQATHDRALALAHRIATETSTDEDAITKCFQNALLRSPTADEMKWCLNHWNQIETLIADDEPSSRTLPDRVRRDAVEENTGEKFSFDENLHAAADFVPDLQPADVPLRTRALADVCLVLLNSNEFSYVD